MDDGSPTRFRLPVSRILRDTFAIPGTHLREFLTPLALPALLLAVLMLGFQLARSSLSAPSGWVLYAIYGAFFTVFAVNCHRLVLLGPSPDTLHPKLRWGMRETRFFVWMVLLAVMFSLGRVVLIVVIANLAVLAHIPGTSTASFLKTGKSGGDLFLWSDYLAFVPCTYIFARISLVLPATAVDRKVNWRWAWRESARNGWRLAVIVAAFPWLLSYGIGMLQRQNATTPELAVVAMLAVVTSALGIVALSLGYGELQQGRQLAAE